MAKSDVTEKTHGMAYWFVVNAIKELWRFAAKHYVISPLLALAMIFAIFLLRAYAHPYVIYTRTHIYIPILGFILYAAYRLVTRKRGWKAKALVATLVLGTIGYFFYSPLNPYEYLTLYYRYRTLEKRERRVLPATDYERIQPLHAIIVRARHKIGDSFHPASTAFVRDGEKYRWTVAVEPVYGLQKIRGGVSEVFDVSATDPAPGFSHKNLHKVNFLCGEHSRFLRNILTNTILRFGLLHYFNSEPAEVRYMRNDEGALVQVVSVIRWRGIIFPRPEFGGVYVIKSVPDNEGAGLFFRQILFGTGKWISVFDIPNHPFLLRQNISPDRVARYVADSFRFHAGFLAPFPWNHKGDMRIPDLPGDHNNQPFTTFFRFSENVNENKPYKFFLLQPYHKRSEAWIMSLFIPGDGQGPVEYYDHSERGEKLTGVSAMERIVHDTKKHYNWGTTAGIAEHRPVFKNVGGRVRSFLFSSVVSFKKGEEELFYSGNIPEVSLTDMEHEELVWVDARDPSTWPATLEEKLSSIWEHKE